MDFSIPDHVWEVAGAIRSFLDREVILLDQGGIQAMIVRASAIAGLSQRRNPILSDAYEKQHPFRHVPTVQPDQWHNFSVFRETFLSDVDQVEANEAFRVFARVQQSLVYSGGTTWPFRYVDATAHRLQAALADLRFLQGYIAFRSERSEDERAAELAAIGDEELVKQHDALLRLSGRFSKKIGALADELEKEVGGWQFKR